MDKIIRGLTIIFILIFISSCGGGQGVTNHLKYFSMFTRNHDSGLDDFAPYSNLYRIGPIINYDDFFSAQFQESVARAKNHNLKLIIMVEKALFIQSDAGLILHPDYVNRIQAIKPILEPLDIAYLYLIGEPMVMRLSNADLNTASDYIKQEFPDIPIMFVESGLPQYLDNLIIPDSVKAFGIDIYDVRNPNTDTGYKAAWHTLKSKLNCNQKIFIVSQAFICPYHAFTESDMPEVINNYYHLAKLNHDVIGIIAFTWDVTGTDIADCKGAIDLPETQAVYKKIGHEITGK